MHSYDSISNIFKRDETHKVMPYVYSEPEFEYLASNSWHVTEKIDGTNIRLIWDVDGYQVRGRTDNAQIPGRLFQRLTEICTRIDSKVREQFADGVCFYGEGYGLGIQKGGCYIADGCDFALFDIKVGPWWLKRDDVVAIAQSLGLDMVPHIATMSLLGALQIVHNGHKSAYGDFYAEGVVCKPTCELTGRSGKRIVAKIKHCDVFGVSGI